QLRHVVLVLADADGLGIDLHQLGQRVLQAAGDGHGTAQRHVQVGEFAGGQFGSRVHRGAGLADHDLGELQARQLPDQLAGQLVGFAAGGTVADGDQVDRKSTRLNSSHVKISYAVFCLKKKKTQTPGQYFTNDQLKERTRKGRAHVESVHQPTQNHRCGSYYMSGPAKSSPKRFTAPTYG